MAIIPNIDDKYYKKKENIVHSAYKDYDFGVFIGNLGSIKMLLTKKDSIYHIYIS